MTVSQPASRKHKKGTTDMTSKAQRLAAVDRQIERLIEERVNIEARIDDEFADGTILTFQKNFGGPKTYNYVGIKSGGRWWMSGNHYAGISLDSLFDLAESDNGTVDGVWIATTLEPLT
jgi:hypothetical protein